MLFRSLLIIQREYKTRVRNRTFLLLTFLAPVFYGLLILMPFLASQIGKEKKAVIVVDKSGRFTNKLASSSKADFEFSEEPLNRLEEEQKKPTGPEHILYIPSDLDIYHPKGILLVAKKNVGAGFKIFLDSILANRISEMKMAASGISHAQLDSLKSRVDIGLRINTSKGMVESSSTATTAAAFAGGFLIYIFIFLYGGLVLRGVQEEKQNRVVEVIISSVKPFELMLGKIIGVALVGLTQFLIWVLLTLFFTLVVGNAMTMMQHTGQMAAQTSGAHLALDSATNALQTLPIPLLIGMFIVFFLGGYLLYSSLFAAFAAAVDSQTDIYQFMFPISLPIVFSIALVPGIIDSPDSTLAFWLSIIPFTSPVIMMARLPFGVDVWQLLLSVGVLAGGFLLTTWLASRIYRVGILMYGKKITYRELAKWLFYKG